MARNRIKYAQGDMYIVSLEDDTVGSEQKGVRPCVILTVDILNMTSDNVIIATITSKVKSDMPQHYLITKEKYSCMSYDNNIIQLENLKTISKSRLGRRIGKLDKEDLYNVLRNIDYNFYEFVIDKPTE